MPYARFVIQLTGISVPPSYHLHRHTITHTVTHTQMHTRRQRCTHPHSPSSHTQIPHPHTHTHNHNGFLTAAVSAGFWNQREGGYYMNQPHTTVVFAVL